MTFPMISLCSIFLILENNTCKFFKEFLIYPEFYFNIIKRCVVKKRFLSLALSTVVCSFSPSYAMLQEQEVTKEQARFFINVPVEFPGHNAKPIRGTVKVTERFDPNDYQQERGRGEGACGFNPIVAGMIRTAHGRKQIQRLFESQDENYVNIRFYSPDSEILKQYERNYNTLQIIYSANLRSLQQALNNSKNDEDMQGHLTRLNHHLEALPRLWEKVLNLANTTVQVPKQFVSREDKGSFPHNNPEWLNLIQQAYMKVTKNDILQKGAGVCADYSPYEEISDKDCFSAVPFCTLYNGAYKKPSGCTNLVCHPFRYALEFFLLSDIPLKSIQISINEDGLNLKDIKDIKAEIQIDKTVLYTPITYNTVGEFTRTHGLSKDLLMTSNMMQFSSNGHGVALFFGDGEIYYYDNVHCPKQATVYGAPGPIFEKTKNFQGKDLNVMGEEEFFIHLFKEINYRLKQVTDVRGQTAVSKTKISFFERPLID